MDKRPLIGLAAGLAGLALAATAHAEWVRTWSAAPEPPSAARGPFPATPSFNDQTVREVVRVSAGGKRVRIRLTNEYGSKPLAIGAAHIALAGPDGSIQAGTDHVLTFAGQASTVVASGAPLLSDPVDMDVPALSSLAVSLYAPGDTGQCTCHGTAMQTLFVSEKGDSTAATSLPPRSGFSPRVFLGGVEVDAPGPASTIVLFGDSITDGVGSTPNANRRWPDLLAERLVERNAGVFAVANQGISGNRVISDGAAQSALARFDRDVLAVPGVRYVVVFEGVNDLGRSDPPPQAASFFGAAEPVTTEAMIAGYRQLIARAHAGGLKIYGATIAPYGGAGYWSAAGEAKRQAINAWIRTSGSFDGVMDFDSVLRDGTDPTQMRADYHAGDHLHGSDAGYKAMADAIDLKLFAAPTK